MASRLRLGPVLAAHREWEQRTNNAPAERMLFVDMDIVDTATGETRHSIDDVGFAVRGDDIEDAVRTARYMWTDGNYACDCNRALHFARATGVDEPEDQPCGDERYRIVEPDWTVVMPVIEVVETPSFALASPSLAGTCSSCGADLDALARTGVTGHVCFGPGDSTNHREPS